MRVCKHKAPFILEHSVSEGECEQKFRDSKVYFPVEVCRTLDPGVIVASAGVLGKGAGYVNPNL